MSKYLADKRLQFSAVGRLTAKSPSEGMKSLLLKWYQYSYLPFFDHRPCDDAGIRTLPGSNPGISVAKSPLPN